MYADFGITQFTTQESQFETTIAAAADTYGVDERILKALVATESSWNPNARGSDGVSFGLMQVTLPTARSVLANPNLTENQLFGPYTNIMAGSKYYSDQLKKYKDPIAAYAAYNAGSVQKNSDGTYVNQSHVNNFIKWYNLYTNSSVPTRFTQTTKMTLGIGGAVLVILVGALFVFAGQKKSPPVQAG